MSTLTIKNITIGEGIPKTIIPLVGKSEGELLQEAKYVNELRPDIVEWRADLFDGVEDLKAVINILKRLKPIVSEALFLFTFRSHKEGGSKEISQQFYGQLIKTVIQTNEAELVDIEFFNEKEVIEPLVNAAKENGVFVVMSNHDFDKTPQKEEIIRRLRAMQELGADLLKIAVMPQSIGDVITLLDATNTMKTKYAKKPLITMAMGEKGIVSRLTGEVFGSACTFAAGKEASAPGQITAHELRQVMDVIHRNTEDVKV